MSAVLAIFVLFVVALVVAGVAVAASRNSKSASRGRTGAQGSTGADGAQGNTGSANFPTFNVIDVSTDTTLTPAESPAIVRIDNSANTQFTITLPAINSASDLIFRFVIVNPGTTDVHLAHTDLALGLISTDVLQTSNQVYGNTNDIVFVGGSQTTGDFVNLTSDTVSWQISATGSATGSITAF